MFAELSREMARLWPIQTRGHRQQMTQGNPIFLGISEIGVFGKERDYRRIEVAEPTAVEGDADQQCDDAFVMDAMSCGVFAS
jgi:hypothetical protein